MYGMKWPTMNINKICLQLCFDGLFSVEHGSGLMMNHFIHCSFVYQMTEGEELAVRKQWIQTKGKQTG